MIESLPRGIHPVIDGRCRGVRESLEDQTMTAAARISGTLRLKKLKLIRQDLGLGNGGC